MNNFIELTLASNYKSIHINYKHIISFKEYIAQYTKQAVTEICMVGEKPIIHVTESPETILMKIDNLTN